jgi:hypothetical protein
MYYLDDLYLTELKSYSFNKMGTEREKIKNAV